MVAWPWAHLVGHSMGAWLAVGVAMHHPKRLSSLAVGGWNLVSGLPPGPKGPLSFDLLTHDEDRAGAGRMDHP